LFTQAFKRNKSGSTEDSEAAWVGAGEKMEEG
jgi:hypothetical protein